MVDIITSASRGHLNHDWLDTYHSFSFGDYYDPQRLGFRSLRVINEDRVAPGAGFGMHGHRDMEIITYIVSGTLEHKDSMGTVSQIRPGDVQHMTAGSGIMHSEYNPSANEPVQLLQIWIKPRELRLTPAYQERHFAAEELADRLCLLAGPDAPGDALPIQQDALLYAAHLAHGASVEHALSGGRHAWVQLITGAVQLIVPGQQAPVELSAGDAAALSEVPGLVLTARAPAQLLLFDLQ